MFCHLIAPKTVRDAQRNALLYSLFTLATECKDHRPKAANLFGAVYEELFPIGIDLLEFVEHP